MVSKLTLPLPWSEVQAQLGQILEEVGLTAVQSFNLHSVRESLTNPELCPCPYHETSQCTCQYMVYILWKQEGKPPVSLEIHGFDEKTYISIVPPSDGVDEDTMNLVRLAMYQLTLVFNPSYDNFTA